MAKVYSPQAHRRRQFGRRQKELRAGAREYFCNIKNRNKAKAAKTRYGSAERPKDF